MTEFEKTLHINGQTNTQIWARDNFLASRQRQCDNIIEHQGPVSEKKKFEK